MIFPLVNARWTHSALVCAKCEKRLKGGFGKKGKTPLSKLLKRAFGKGRKATIGVASVKCLGVCPQGAVTVIDTRSPREWMLVKAGTPVEDVAAALGG